MKINEKMRKVFSILLCLLMLVQYVPTTAFAADVWKLEDRVLVVTGTLTELPPGVDYDSIRVEEGGELALGSIEVSIPVTNYGTISSGTFSGEVTNLGTISGGTISKVVHKVNGTDTALDYLDDLGAGKNLLKALGDAGEGKAWYRGEIPVGENETVTLHYTEYTAKTVYAITTSFDSEYGSVSAPATAAEGETVTLTVTPKTGYVVDTVSYQKTEDTSATTIGLKDGTYSFEMPAGSVSVTATFKTADYYVTDGVLYVNTKLTGLPEGEYTKIQVNQGGELALGTAEVSVPVENSGTISDGKFNGEVSNYGVISNGTFSGSCMVENKDSGKITGGKFDGSVYNYGTVSGSLSGTGSSFATFGDYVYNYNKITMAKFTYSAELMSRGENSKNPESVIHHVGGNDTALDYGANLQTALTATNTAGADAAWYCGDTLVGENETVPLNYTVYTAKTVYAITTSFNSEYGSVSAPATAAAGETVTLTVTAEDSYKLAGLTVKDGSDNNVEWDLSSDDGTYTFSMPNGSVTVTAEFQPTCSVTFEVNGGLGGNFVNTPFDGSPVEIPEDPEHQYGMEFAGWYTSKDGGTTLDQLWDFDTPVTGNVTLYAKWILPKSPDFSKLLDYNNSSSGTSAEYGYSYTWTVDGDTRSFVLTLKGPGTSGKDIDAVVLPGNNGSVLNITLNSEAETTISDLTLGYLEGGSYAGNFYDKITFSGNALLTIVEMYLQGTNDSTIEVAAGANVTVNDTDGMNFGQSGGTDSTLIVNGTLHADGGTYCGQLHVGSNGVFRSFAQIRLNGMIDGGNLDLNNLLVVEIGGKLIVDCNEAALYIDASGNDVLLTDVVKLPAGYLLDPYKVVWVADGNGGYSRIITIDDGKEFPEFIGVPTGAGFDLDELFYAATSLNLPMSGATLKYDANGGQGTAPAAQSKVAGTEVTVAENPFRWEHGSFLNWNTKADGSGTAYAPGSSITLHENTTLYAQWEEYIHTVTFLANDGSNSIRAERQDIGEATPAALDANPFSRTGYTFTGWNTKADGSGTAYTDGQMITLSADLTLYAQWKIDTYTVTWMADGKTVDTETVAYGASATKDPTVPAKEGYTGKWDKTATNVTANVTITAVYTVNKYTVTYVADGKTVDTQTVEHGKDAVAPEIPAKTGYTAKWDSDGKNITADTTITAVYEAIPATVSPASGDSFNVMLWTAMFFGSILAMAVLVMIRKTFTYKGKYVED